MERSGCPPSSATGSAAAIAPATSGPTAVHGPTPVHASPVARRRPLDPFPQMTRPSSPGRSADLTGAARRPVEISPIGHGRLQSLNSLIRGIRGRPICRRYHRSPHADAPPPDDDTAIFKFINPRLIKDLISIGDSVFEAKSASIECAEPRGRCPGNFQGTISKCNVMESTGLLNKHFRCALRDNVAPGQRVHDTSCFLASGSPTSLNGPGEADAPARIVSG